MLGAVGNIPMSVIWFLFSGCSEAASCHILHSFLVNEADLNTLYGYGQVSHAFISLEKHNLVRKA